MGTACACPSANAVPVTPRPQPPQNLSSLSYFNSYKKFEDIRPIEKENIDESMDGIKLLQNQLSGRINEYERQNGFITNRFDMLWP